MEEKAQDFVDFFKPAGGFEQAPTVDEGTVKDDIPDDDGLFSAEFEKSSDIADLFSRLVARYPEVLSKPRATSKCYQEAFKFVNQLLGGTFLCGHDWDKSWLNKVCGKYPVEDLIWDMKNIEDRCDKVLHYLRCTPNHYYRKGKHSIADFLCSRMRSGKCWSPLIDILTGDCMTLDMYNNMLGDKLMAIIDDTLKSVWFTADNETKKKFCGGVMSLYSWYVNERESIIRACPENAVWFHSFSSLLELIKLCNEDTRFLYPTYTNPFMKNWETFKSWCLKRGCKV